MRTGPRDSTPRWAFLCLSDVLCPFHALVRRQSHLPDAMPRSANQRRSRRREHSPNYCPVCRNLNPGLWNAIQTPELAASRDSGACQSCTLVATAIEAFWPLDSLSAVALEFCRHNRHGHDQPRDALILLPCDEKGHWGEEGSSRSYIEVFTTQSVRSCPFLLGDAAS